MTERERKRRAAVKKQLQKKGVLPPDKPRINRRKYAKETIAEFEETMSGTLDGFWLREAIGMMVSKDMKKVSDEEMGVLRMLKLAVEYKKFHEKLRAQGRDKYRFEELYNEIYAPVMGLPGSKGGLSLLEKVFPTT